MIIIKEIEFSDILFVWQNELWPNRKSLIEPVNAIGIGSELDFNIMSSVPVFYGIYLNGEIVPCLSSHASSLFEFRIRGMCTRAECRKRCFASSLVDHLLEYARCQDFKTAWIMTRIVNEEFFINSILKRLCMFVSMNRVHIIL